MSPADLSTLLQALILAGIVALLRFAFNHSSRLRTVETVLTGSDGNNGVKSQVDQLERDVQRIDNEQGRMDERLKGMERVA